MEKMAFKKLFYRFFFEIEQHAKLALFENHSAKKNLEKNKFIELKFQNTTKVARDKKHFLG